MMLFQQLQLYQQQSDNQYAQMNIGQHISDCQDQQSIFEQHLGTMEDSAMIGLTMSTEVMNEVENKASQSANNALSGLFKELGDLNALNPKPADYEAQKAQIEAKIDAQRAEVNRAVSASTNRQNATGLLMTNISQGIKRSFQAIRNGKMMVLKTKEKRLQTQLKTLEAQGTYIDKRLEKVEKQLESSIKDMTPGFGVSQG